MIRLLVDDTEIETEEEKTLLQVCLDNDIYIPNLCYLENTDSPHASCRLCFVEIGGDARPVASCTVKIRENMTVRTDTPAVRQLQRTAFQFFMSTHLAECRNCPANKQCELQKIAKFLKVGLKSKGIGQRLKEPVVDESHPLFNYYPNRCVLCGKCIHICRSRHGQAFLTFARRGIDTVISFYGENDVSKIPGGKCMACVEICPVKAITLKEAR